MSNLNDYLVAHYKMDDNADSTVVLDSSVNGYNGTSARNTSLMHAAGKIGGALNFNGTSDYVITNSTFGDVLQNSFTVSVDVMVDMQDDRLHHILGSDNGNDSAISFFLQIDATAKVIYANYQNTTIPRQYVITWADCSFFKSDKWYMITATVEKTSPTTITTTIYINGYPHKTLSGSCSMEAEGTFVNLSIGDMYSVLIDGIVGLPTKGSLDDVRIYNKALSAAEVQYLYNLATQSKRSIYGGIERSIYGGSTLTEKSIYGGK